jgi:hypothetical protein
MNKFLIILLFSWIESFSFSQSQSVKIDFKPVYGEKEIHFNEKIQVDSLNWIAFSKVKFYIGNFKSYSNGYSDSSHMNGYYLIDFSDSSSLTINYESVSTPDSICFLIGTDSLTNISGLFDGALDPLNGMYWAWNSGYINIKIEGSSSFASSPDKKFEFHIGGYGSPYATSKELCFNTKSNEVDFTLDLSKIIIANLLERSPSITIPGINAMMFSDNFKNAIFQIE